MHFFDQTLGKSYVVKSSKNSYLVKKRDTVKKEYGEDYEDTEWLDTCSLNSAKPSRGKETSKRISGCEKLILKCDGGCLKIIDFQYSCEHQQIREGF